VYAEQAAFFRAALLLGLVRGEAVVEWSDRVLTDDANAPAAFVDIASTPTGDLTALRHALYPLCEGHESTAVVQRLLALVADDFDRGRRSFDDTVTVLSQVRRFLQLDSATDDGLKALLVEVWRARHRLGGAEPAAAESSLRAWLADQARPFASRRSPA
jgi:hypothetical protein